MFKNLIILGTLAIIVALPFLFRQPAPAGEWVSGDPVLNIVSPHNEAIRYEFALAFSRWHKEKFGRPVKIDWRSIGGTSEISRYLIAEYTASTRGWWERSGKTWPGEATEKLTLKAVPEKPEVLDVYNALRTIDDPTKITSNIDLFFGGGEFDHTNLLQSGLTVPAWQPGTEPAGLFKTADGVELIPAKVSGETWRTPTLFGNCLSTFGICYNNDLLDHLGVKTPPSSWNDLADPVYYKQVGVADPTKSGSIAKAFEMIIHQKIHDRVIATGFSDAEIAKLEKYISEKKWKPGQKAEEFPRIEVYNRAVEGGWVDGLHLVQRIGANARYFTDSASKVPIDVSIGDAAVGMSIDFYGRFQSQNSLGPNGEVRMVYVTPVGGTSVSCDPVGLLRGAPHREIAVRFIQFCLSEEGQRLWTYKPGTPGGPEKYALRRLPIRRDFYPSTNPSVQSSADRHRPNAEEDLADPTVDPYAVAKNFIYYRRWTGGHFAVQSEIIRAMCMDSADELKTAWEAIRDAGGPEKVPQAMAKLGQLPTVSLPDKQGTLQQVPLGWSNAPAIRTEYNKLDYMREWTSAFRANYAEAAELAKQGK